MSVDDYLRQLAAEGLARRGWRSCSRIRPCAPRARRNTTPACAIECDTIIGMGFPGYFLIVADFIGWAKANDVPVGPGQGIGRRLAGGVRARHHRPRSAAVCAAVRALPESGAGVDAGLRHRLLPGQPRAASSSTCATSTAAMRSSQIATFGTMASKAVIRDAGRVLDMPYTFCDQLSKLIPIVQAKPLSLDKALEEEPILAERERKEEEVRELLALARPPGGHHPQRRHARRRRADRAGQADRFLPALQGARAPIR